MVMSMTGYGAGREEHEGMTISIEMRSVNNRYLDIVTKLPRTLSHIEMDIKKIIQTYFKRGRIEVYVSLSGDMQTNKTLHIDWNLLDQYVHQLHKAKKKYALAGDIPLESLTSIEDVFTIDDEGLDTSTLDAKVKEAIHAVSDKLKVHRKSEGEYLMKDIKERLVIVQQLLDHIRANQNMIAEQYRERILARLHGHLENTISIEEADLIKDVAILAEKGDITEEVTRLASHMEHFQTVIEQDEVIGRKLDFITQEMHREVNTIGAKSVDPDLSTTVVKLKSEIEKIKEQIQNME